MTSDDQTPGRTAVARRPQELVRALLGVVDADLGCSQPIPVRVYLEVLTELGVSEVACRATLSRMAKKGALERSREGRSVAFRASPRTRDLLFRDRERILSSSPFEHPGDGWTVLMFSVPESRRDVRHRLRTRLSWAGFGPLGDGLWIAPGSPDVDDVLIVVQDPADPGSSITVFDAVPRLPTRAEDVVAQAWNLPAVRGEHDTFLQEWEAVEESELERVGHPLGAERGLDPAPSSRPRPSRSLSPPRLARREIDSDLSPALRAARPSGAQSVHGPRLSRRIERTRRTFRAAYRRDRRFEL